MGIIAEPRPGPGAGRRGACAVALALALAAGACGTETYQAAPIDAGGGADRLIARRLDDPAVAEALAAAGLAVPAWPLPEWSLDALTVAAIHLDPEVAAARAAWRTRQASVAAVVRANPVVQPSVAYDTSPDAGDPPWTVGVAVELPIAGADKRAALVARAEAKSEAARQDIVRAGWQRRKAVRAAFLACNRATLLQELTRRQIALHEEIVAIYERRREAGESSLTEVNLARQGIDGARLAEAALAGELESCRGALAGALGVSYQAARALPLDARALSLEAPQPPSDEIRRRALLGRADLNAALAGYAAAEAALRLEVARQYPDLTLTPALFWDQGGLVWSLGASVVAAILHRNEGPIAEARSARDAAAQAVLAVQGRVLAALAEADAATRAEHAASEAAGELVARARSRLDLARRRLAGGDIGRLEVIAAELALSEAQSGLLAHKLALLALNGGYEDIVERVLVGDASPALDVSALSESAPSWFERAP